jgi:hypothetical protein
MAKNKENKKEEANIMQEVADFANKNNGLIFMVGNPIRDELYISFNGKQSLLKFPKTPEMKENVLIRILKEGTFKSAMNEFLTGLIKSLGVDEKKGLQLYQMMGGTLQSMLDIKKIIKK